MRASAALAASRKSVIFMWSFFPGDGLDARAGIDAPGLGERDGARDVGGIEAAGHDDAMAGAAGQGPIEGAAGAAVEFGGGAVEQQGFGGSSRPIARNRSRRRRARPSRRRGRRDTRRALRRRAAAPRRAPRCARCLRCAPAASLTNTPTRRTPGGGDAGGRFGRDVARAFGIEIEADGGGAGGDGGVGVGLVGDAADLEDHRGHQLAEGARRGRRISSGARPPGRRGSRRRAGGRYPPRRGCRSR